MQKNCCFLGCLLLLVLSAGCVTHRPELNTWRDDRFAPSPTNTLAFTARPNPSAEDAALGQMLVAEMRREGFVFVPEAQADYLLTYVLDDTMDERTYVEIHPHESMMSVRPLTPQTTQQAIYSSYSPMTGADTVTTLVFHSKDIRLYLYTNPKTHPGGLQMAWQGNMAAGKSVTAARELQLIRTLLGYFGKDQNGRVNLAQ